MFSHALSPNAQSSTNYHSTTSKNDASPHRHSLGHLTTSRPFYAIPTKTHGPCACQSASSSKV